MAVQRKQILDKFQAYLAESYDDYCVVHGQASSVHGFITYMIDQDLISASNIRRYTILREYKVLSVDQAHGRKTKNVSILSERFNVSERSIWSILRHAKQVNS